MKEPGVDYFEANFRTYTPTPGNCRFGDHTIPMLPCALDANGLTCDVKCFCAAQDRPDGLDVVWEKQS